MSSGGGSSSSAAQSSSASSSLYPSAVNTANSTPWQSPITPSRSQFTSPQKTWSGETRTARRLNKDSTEQEVQSFSSAMNTASSKNDSTKSVRRSNTVVKPSSDTNDLDGFSIPTRTTSNASNRSTNSQRDQWWEHVVPPGQLAERLRRAQKSSTKSSSSRASSTVEDGPKSSRKAILRNATPSERKIWSSLADFDHEEERATYNQSGANSTRSSVGSLPSVRSDLSSISAASSSAEDSPLDVLSPPSRDEMDQRSFPWQSSISRSTSCRRSRVMSDATTTSSTTNIGLGLGGGPKAAPEVDEQLRQWNFTSSPPSSTSNTYLRPFPTTTGGRQSPFHILADTPEMSSEEDQSEIQSVTSSTTKTRTTRRISRTTSSVRSLDVDAVEASSTPRSSKRQSMPASASDRRLSWNTQAFNDRHVSFNRDVEVSGDELWQSQTIGRAAGRSHSMLNNAKGKSWQNDTPTRRSFKPFPSSTPEAKVHSQFFHHLRGPRQPCYSAPTSPRVAFQSLHEDKSNSRRSHVKTMSASDKHSPDLAFMSSLGVAQSQLASAGSMALTLTRQLSLPLRPMLQLTMFLSISSFTFMALAGFLVAGYLITAWDDVNNRGKRVQQNVSSARKSLEAGVHWCGTLLTREESTSTTTSTSSNSSHRHSTSMVTAPIRFAFAVPMTVAYKLTPTSITESLGYSDKATTTGESIEGKKFSSSSSSNTKSSSSSIPPRPPLSSLLPSIFLTILITLGACVASFFAGRAVPTPSPSSASSFTTTSPSSPPLPHASSQIPIRKRSSVSSQYSRRQPYDIVSV